VGYIFTPNRDLPQRLRGGFQRFETRAHLAVGPIPKSGPPEINCSVSSTAGPRFEFLRTHQQNHTLMLNATARDNARTQRQRRMKDGRACKRPDPINTTSGSPRRWMRAASSSKMNIKALGLAIKHDPEKWLPVFGKDHARTSCWSAIPKSHRALATPGRSS